MIELPFSRRALIGGIAAAPFIQPSSFFAQLPFADYPFTLGVASGDPAPDGFVIWTRLAPQPLEPHGGMPMARVVVGWEVAADDRFKEIVASGDATAWPELAHTVHVEVAGLRPGRPYWYRFRAGDEKSYAGQARTLPAAGSAVDKVRFAVAGCQHYEAGYYTAYRHMSAENVDFVYHFGDYIYEYSSGFVLDERRLPIPPVRRHGMREPFSLDDYRRFYALYKLDADLQAAHAAAPWIVTYDDHEVRNNWVGEIDQDGTPPEIFLFRRAAALQAWYEHMPIRRRSMPRGNEIDITRRLAWGDLARIHALDTRQFRSDQPCDDGFKPACPGIDARDASVLGAAQERWLADGLRAGKARWNVIAQQIMMMKLDRRRDFDTEAAPIFNVDSWAGYSQPRERMLELFGGQPDGSVIVLTGDEHQNFAGELKRGDKIVAAEFVGTSICSGGDGQDFRPGNKRIMASNSELRGTNDQRGYLLCEATPEAWKTSWRVLDRVTAPGGTISTRATWVVEAGKAGMVEG